MAKTPIAENPRQVATEVAIGELFSTMIERDKEMWERLSNRDAQLQDQMVQLFARLLDANSLDQVLAKGFDEITCQLAAQTAPLRSLGREYTKLDHVADKQLAALQRALERPDFTLDPRESAIRTISAPAISERSIAS